MKKKIFAIAVITALTVSTLCGCGKKNEVVETTTTAVVEESTTVTEEPTTTESTEEITEPSTNKATSTEAAVEITDEYLANYPLTAGNQKVYVRSVDGFNFYENAAYHTLTYGGRYATDNIIDLFANEADAIIDDTTRFVYDKAYIEYIIAENNSNYTLAWYETNKDKGYDVGFDSETFEITDTETFENGLTVSKITYNYSSNGLNFYDVFYVCEYKINDSYSVIININGIINYNGTNYSYDNTEAANTIIDFYRNCETIAIAQ